MNAKQRRKNWRQKARDWEATNKAAMLDADKEWDRWVSASQPSEDV